MNLSEYKISSKRGKPKLNYNGYPYNQKTVFVNRIFWRCNKDGCTGKIYTDRSNNFISSSEHNHSKLEKDECELILLAMKDRSLLTSETARLISLSALENVDNSVVVSHSPKYYKDQITKFRKRNLFTLQEGEDIPEEIKYTVSGARFLLYDSGVRDLERIVIFSTETNLIHLNYNKTWVCDGTFSVVPSNFEQLYTIQIQIRNKFVPILFCLMKRKNSRSYEKLFELLKNVYHVTDPHNIIMDFEQASFNMHSNVFPSSTIHGCLFHFSQIIWRYIQRNRLTINYKKEINFKFHVKMILALAFVPVFEVEHLSNNLKAYFIRENVSSNVVVLHEWIRSNYIYSLDTSIKSKKFWNVYERTLNLIPITSNSIEGFHRHLNNINDTINHNIFNLGTQLKKIQQESEMSIMHSLYNVISVPVLDLDELSSILVNYSNYYDVSFLQVIALKFRFHLDITI